MTASTIYVRGHQPPEGRGPQNQSGEGRRAAPKKRTLNSGKKIWQGGKKKKKKKQHCASGKGIRTIVKGDSNVNDCNFISLHHGDIWSFMWGGITRDVLVNIYNIYKANNFAFRTIFSLFECSPQGECTVPRGTAIPGRCVERTEQAPNPTPDTKNPFNRLVPHCRTYQLSNR